MTALLAITGCFTAAQSGLVYAVAKYDERIQKKKKKYSALDKCIIEGRPDTYELGNKMLEIKGQNTEKYNVILSRSPEEVKPQESTHLAYAFYIIADELDDNRAKVRINWLENNIPSDNTNNIRKLIEDKYLVSYLDKCFTVPEEYKITKTIREIIKEDSKVN